MKDRLDKILLKKGLVATRSQAKSLIEQGLVLIKDKIALKVSELVSIEDDISVNSPIYVGRGAYKLLCALEKFNLKPTGVWMDVGASTGGFTEILISSGVDTVYAVDVGVNQLSEKLKNNPKVINLEKTDIRELSGVENLVDGMVIDVSFISVLKIFPILHKFLKPEAKIICLIKPQFEIGLDLLPRDGVVKDEKLRNELILSLKSEIIKLAFTVHDIIESPILGKSGNKEYLFYLTKDQN